MTTHNGKRVTQRGGADAGRGDDAHGVTESEETKKKRIQWEKDYADAADRYYSEKYDF